MMYRILMLLAVLVAQSIPAVAESREKDLDRWVDRDLIPYVRQQLIVHPRFKGETVMFVVLDDNAPASTTNALALSMRDRLLAAAVATRGVESVDDRVGVGLEAGHIAGRDVDRCHVVTGDIRAVGSDDLRGRTAGPTGCLEPGMHGRLRE